MGNKGVYYSGTSGLLLPVPNKEFFPEAFKTKSRLCYYGSLYNSIEINSSFYKVPLASTVARWVTEVPDDFKFTFKLWREITHNKSLNFSLEAVDDFMRRISAVGHKKGCLLVQFPGSVRSVHLSLVERLLDRLRKADPDVEWRVAVEFRHQSWYQQDTFDMMDRHEMALVLHDKLSEGGVFMDNQTDFVYVRFHGPQGDYKGSYSEAFLYEYASYINEWLEEGKQVYTYFNNTIGHAIENMESLRRLL